MCFANILTTKKPNMSAAFASFDAFLDSITDPARLDCFTQKYSRLAGKLGAWLGVLVDLYLQDPRRTQSALIQVLGKPRVMAELYRYSKRLELTTSDDWFSFVTYVSEGMATEQFEDVFAKMA
ncbi:hypothetical protein FI667_g5269, partial [Globisporangium splendens]